ncbi:MAG: DNA polymerase I [Acetobacteraceae bacterium]
MEQEKHLILVDGSSFIFRAFHALPPMHSPDGTPVNAVYGFTNMLSRLMREHVGTHLAVIFDAGRQTFRNDIYPAYKAHRPPAPEDLVPQFALIREATKAFNIPSIELPGWEADDLIASYAEVIAHEGGRCTIVSSDKDLMQLVTGKVQMLDPIKQRPIGVEEVLTKFGVPPERVVDVQALMGDSTDNVPGVPGIGPKGAAQLIVEFGRLEDVLTAAPDMKPSKRRDALSEHAENARLSLKLVTLARDVALPEPIEALGCRDPSGEMLGGFLAQMGFNSISQRLGLRHVSRPIPLPAAQDGDAPMPDATAPPASPAEQPNFGPYETVTTTTQLESWVQRIKAEGYIAVDTETDSLQPRRAALIGISLAVRAGEAAYIPLRHQGDLENLVPPQLETAQVLAALTPVFHDDVILKIFQNAKYDLLVFQNAGVTGIAPIDDTMLLSYAQSAGAHGHGMDELSLLHLGHRPITYDEVTGTGRQRIPFAHVSVDKATSYAAEDADVTFRLWLKLKAMLVQNCAVRIYETMERPLIPVLQKMEWAGIKIDVAALQRLSTDFAARMKVMEAEIHQLVGRDFNIGSPKQLGEILFDEMNLSGGKRTKAGAWGTDSSVLQELADQGHVLPQHILAWRQLAKLKSTYTDALLEQRDPKTARVHTSYHMAGTTTGRLSSNDPNLQNIPIRTEEGARIRHAFIAEKGHKLVSADYSQIELRLLAVVANIPTLQEAFALGQDIHARTASEVFSVPLEGMDPLTRRRAKAINFGIIYGISAFGLARQLGIPQNEARRYIATYFERYPGIKTYMDRTKEEAREKGYVETPFGRRCYVPGIAEKNGARRAYAERQAINAPLQGGAADIIKMAMISVDRQLRDNDFNAQLLLQVHDELIFEVAVEKADMLAGFLRETMSSVADIGVKLVVETGIGDNWAEAH